MLHSPCWRDAARGWESLPFLLGFRRGRGEILPLGGRQRLVFGPLVAKVAALLGRHLGEAFVVFAGLRALLRGEPRPGLHASLHALLFFGLHLRVAVSDADPLAAALRLELFPVPLGAREDLLLIGSEFGPCRALL